jgi:hypothetical protein
MIEKNALRKKLSLYNKLTSMKRALIYFKYSILPTQSELLGTYSITVTRALLLKSFKNLNFFLIFIPVNYFWALVSKCAKFVEFLLKTVIHVDVVRPLMSPFLSRGTLTYETVNLGLKDSGLVGKGFKRVHRAQISRQVQARASPEPWLHLLLLWTGQLYHKNQLFYKIFNMLKTP